MIDQHTQLYGVVGHPLSHSLSPAMHNEGFSATGLNAVYLAFETRDIQGCIRAMRAIGIRGLSVTIPHKTAVIPLLEELDELARKIGAVNTVVNKEGRLLGYNTDGLGALMALKEETGVQGKTCLILGAGGAARAVGFALKDAGVHLTIANRSEDRGRRVADSLGCAFLPLRDVKMVDHQILINATSVGMYPREDEAIVPPEALGKDTVVMDIVYNPVETKLIRIARARGLKAIDGLGMFLRQGAEQFRLWTGLEPPLGVMREAVITALGR